jgi:hypothetical protein
MSFFLYFLLLGCWHAAFAGARGWEPQRFRQEEHSQSKPTEARSVFEKRLNHVTFKPSLTGERV